MGAAGICQEIFLLARLCILDLQVGELSRGVPQNPNRGRTILGNTAGHMQAQDFLGCAWLSPDENLPQRLIRRGLLEFQEISEEDQMVRPAGIEPATPAFGGQYSIH
jgi:hypothetical protein